MDAKTLGRVVLGVVAGSIAAMCGMMLVTQLQHSGTNAMDAIAYESWNLRVAVLFSAAMTTLAVLSTPARRD